jgi:hypothetical protein
MEEESQEFLDELYAIENKANSVETCQNFIEFLDMLQKEILKEDEVDKRLQTEFFDVVRRNLTYSQRFPNHDLSIEIPPRPDWNWLARLFLVGAFEN